MHVAKTVVHVEAEVKVEKITIMMIHVHCCIQFHNNDRIIKCDVAPKKQSVQKKILNS